MIDINSKKTVGLRVEVSEGNRPEAKYSDNVENNEGVLSGHPIIYKGLPWVAVSHGHHIDDDENKPDLTVFKNTGIFRFPKKDFTETFELGQPVYLTREKHKKAVTQFKRTLFEPSEKIWDWYCLTKASDNADYFGTVAESCEGESQFVSVSIGYHVPMSVIKSEILKEGRDNEPSILDSIISDGLVTKIKDLLKSDENFKNMVKGIIGQA